MTGILPVWLGLVRRGDVNLGVQLLEQNEGMPVDIPSVSIWTVKNRAKRETTKGDSVVQR